MIDLIKFFDKMEDYIIMRIDNNFPKFNIGYDDVDILCLNMDRTCKHILNILKTEYPNLSYRIFPISKKIHIDIFAPKEYFIIKFDICDNLNKLYPLYNITDNLTKEVVNTSILHKSSCKIPTLKNELMLRRLEYDSYIESRPDKIKHLRYIEKYPEVKYTKFIKI